MLSDDVFEKIRESALDSISVFTKKGERKLSSDTNLYVYKKVLSPGLIVNPGSEKLRYKIEKKSVFVLVDKQPRAKWAHPCQHQLYDAETGELYKKIELDIPPRFYFIDHKNVEVLHTPVKFVSSIKKRKKKIGESQQLSNAIKSASGKRYAILFSGDSYYQDLNDLEFLYRTLLDVYEFDPNDIYVLNFDGTSSSYPLPEEPDSYPIDDTPYRLITNGPGTGDAFENTIDILKTKIQNDDLLFIFTNNHGNRFSGESMLLEYRDSGFNTYYGANAFANKLNELPEFETLLVTMGQCRSGGFAEPIIEKTTARRTFFSSACGPNGVASYGEVFAPYPQDWTGAIAGQYADGSSLLQNVDIDGNTRISAMEAFTYALEVVDPADFDTPMFAEKSESIGNHIYLGYPAYDLFIRDSLQDIGDVPSVADWLCFSPDIIIFNANLADPQGTLGTPSAMGCDDLGEAVEYGQDNYIYARVQNRGRNPATGSIKLCWSELSTFNDPSRWYEINELAITNIAPGEVKVIGPFVWNWRDIPNIGHYCFIGLVHSIIDPEPDSSHIQDTMDFHYFVRDNNNVAWKNFNVVDLLPNTLYTYTYSIRNIERRHMRVDLDFDLLNIPEDVEFEMIIPERILPRKIQFKEIIKHKSNSNIHQKLQIKAGKKLHLRNLLLKPNESIRIPMTIKLPKNIKNGAYTYSIGQQVKDFTVGRFTQRIIVDSYPYIAIMETNIIHKSNCRILDKTKTLHKKPYRTLEKALKHRYCKCPICIKKLMKK
ncbi:MAG: hypothetical protein ACTSPM_02630 [Candidatus Heimdallarchaeota archaeon]